MQKSLIILFLFLFATCVPAQDLDTRLADLESEITQLMEVYHTVGLSVAVVENNELIYTRGFGYRDLERKLPVTPHTRFGVGSVTKQFTASIIGILEGQGKLSLQDKPSLHIAGLRFYSEEMNKLLSIEDLLTHSSGIGGVDGTSVFFPTDDIDKHLARLPYLRPNSGFRERFDYSNMGYDILGAIGEKITQQPWEDNLQEYIFEPLGMQNSAGTLDGLMQQNDVSLGYSVVDNQAIKVPYADQHESAAAGEMVSTAHDMGKWMLMLLGRGSYKGKQVVPQTFLENAFNSQRIIRPGFRFEEERDLLFDHYGYGWFVHTYQNTYRVNHGGNVSGFTALIELYPYKNVGIVVLTNQHSSGIISNISGMIADRILGREIQSWDQYQVQVQPARTYNREITPINTDQKPTHPLNDFCGRYLNEGYGEIEIALNEGTLSAKLPAFTFPLEHQYHNIFVHRPQGTLHQNVPTFAYHFLMNDYGVITSLAMDLQAEPVVFRKLED